MQANLQTVLLAGASELADLATVADQLGAVGSSDVERWQALDRLSQHLAGLAVFLAELAGTVPEVPLDVAGALAGLKTAALADRLAGRACHDDYDAGALELFQA